LSVFFWRFLDILELSYILDVYAFLLSYLCFVVLLIRRPPRSTPRPSSAASDVDNRQHQDGQQVGLGRLAEVLIISRNVLVIRLDDGTEIKLVR